MWEKKAFYGVVAQALDMVPGFKIRRRNKMLPVVENKCYHPLKIHSRRAW